MRALTLFTLLLLVSPSAAFAGNNEVGVVVVGEATMQPQLAAQLEAWLQKHGHKLTPAPLPPDAINTLVDCFVIEDETCARKVVQARSKTNTIIFAKVDLKVGDDSPERTVTLSVFWFDKTREPLAERRYCERCTDVTLRSTADELMAALVALGGNAKTAGKVKISSTPAGAKVVIDGDAIGVTPLEYDLKSGSHKVTVSHADHREDSRDFTISSGETTTLDISLETSGRSKKLVPAILLGSGAALLVTGVVLFALDEDHPAPVGPQEPTYRDTAPLGIGLAIGGAVVGGIGGYLLYRQKRSSAPVAAVTPNGATFGWAGSF
jgi:hypothetical protein